MVHCAQEGWAGSPKGMCPQSPIPRAGQHQQSHGVWGRPGRRQTQPEELMNADSSWLKGEGKSGQSLEKGEEF